MGFFRFLVVFAVFGLGLVFVFQAIVGKEINTGWLRLPFDPDRPGMQHPPERHPVRLFLIGLGLMVAAVILGLMIL